jgi:hypothetical protein
MMSDPAGKFNLIYTTIYDSIAYFLLYVGLFIYYPDDWKSNVVFALYTQ